MKRTAAGMAVARWTSLGQQAYHPPYRSMLHCVLGRPRGPGQERVCMPIVVLGVCSQRERKVSEEASSRCAH